MTKENRHEKDDESDLAGARAGDVPGAVRLRHKTDDSNTAADGKRTFIMGVDPEYPPFSYLGDDGKYTGFDVEIAQAACDLLGW